MGIYLPNMEMPKRGHTVTITIVGSGQAYVEYYDCRPHVEETIEYAAVPVPPHGRLIDAAARVNVQMYNDEFEDFHTVNMSIDDLLDSSWIELEDDPTIIPEDHEEEEMK